MQGILRCDEGKIKQTRIEIKENKRGVEIFIDGNGDPKAFKCLCRGCKHSEMIIIDNKNELRGYTVTNRNNLYLQIERSGKVERKKVFRIRD